MPSPNHHPRSNHGGRFFNFMFPWLNKSSSTYSELANWNGGLSSEHATSQHSSSSTGDHRKDLQTSRKVVATPPSIDTTIQVPESVEALKASIENENKSLGLGKNEARSALPPNAESVHPSPVSLKNLGDQGDDVVDSEAVPFPSPMHHPEVTGRQELEDLSDEEGHKAVLAIANCEQESPKRPRISPNRRARLSVFVSLPPLPHGVRKSDYKDANSIKLLSSLPLPVQGAGVQTFDSVAEALTSMFQPDHKAVDAPASNSTAKKSFHKRNKPSAKTSKPIRKRKRRFSAVEKGKGRARNDSEVSDTKDGMVPAPKKPRLNPSKSGNSISRKIMAASSPTSVLHAFNIDLGRPPTYIHPLALLSSLRNIWSPNDPVHETFAKLEDRVALLMPSSMVVSNVDATSTIPMLFFDLSHMDNETEVLHEPKLSPTSTHLEQQRPVPGPSKISLEDSYQRNGLPRTPISKGKHRFVPNTLTPSSSPSLDPDFEAGYYLTDLSSTSKQQLFFAASPRSHDHQSTFVPTIPLSPSFGILMDRRDAPISPAPVFFGLPELGDGADQWTLSGDSRYSTRSSSELAEDASWGYPGDGTIDPSLLCDTSAAEISQSPPSRFPSLSPRSSRPFRRVAKRKFYADMIMTDDVDLSDKSSSTDEDDLFSAYTSSHQLDPEPKPRKPKQGPSKVSAHSSTVLKPKAVPSSEAAVGVDPGAYKEKQVTFCHQCRRKSNWKKMKCSFPRPDGSKCTKLFCWRCIHLRYPDITFDDRQSGFICPFCMETCNCTQCCSKRGETYVSSRFQKINLGGSASQGKGTRRGGASIRGRTRGGRPVGRGGKRAKGGLVRQARPAFDKVTLPSIDFSGDPTDVPTTYWATVYGLEGEELGTAWVGQNGADKVIVSQAATPDLQRNKAKRVFIGVAQDWWGVGSGVKVNEKLNSEPPQHNWNEILGPGTSKIFIGKRSVLFPRMAHIPPPVLSMELLQDQISPGPEGYDLEHNDPSWSQDINDSDMFWSSHVDPEQFLSSGFHIELDEFAVEKAIRAGFDALDLVDLNNEAILGN